MYGTSFVKKTVRYSGCNVYYLLWLREDSYYHGTGVHSITRVGFRNSLNPVDTPFIFHFTIDIVARHAYVCRTYTICKRIQRNYLYEQHVVRG